MRRVVVAILTIVLAACATQPASADPFESAQPQLLDACVQSAGASRDALQQCVGLVANPCIVTDGSATSSYVLCWSAEADAWRTHLDQAMTRLNETQQHRSPSRLAEANKAWPHGSTPSASIGHGKRAAARANRWTARVATRGSPLIAPSV